MGIFPLQRARNPNKKKKEAKNANEERKAKETKMVNKTGLRSHHHMIMFL